MTVVNPISLEKGLRVDFNKAFTSAPAEYSKIATVIPSTAASEDYGWLGGAPQMREWVDERIPKGLINHDWTIKNKDWESSIAVDRNAIDDDQYGMVQMRVRDLAERAKSHPDSILADLIESGLNTVCYDGQYFFDSDHSEGNSGTNTNLSTSDITTTTAPTQTELAAAFTAARQVMRGITDDQGEPFGGGTKITIVCAPGYQDAFETLQKAEYVIQGVTNTLRGAFELIVLPQLAAPSTTPAFYMLDVSHYVRPFILQSRQPIQFNALEGQKTETGFMRKKFFYGVDARYNVGFGLWQYAVKHLFT